MYFVCIVPVEKDNRIEILTGTLKNSKYNLVLPKYFVDCDNTTIGMGNGLIEIRKAIKRDLGYFPEVREIIDEKKFDFNNVVTVLFKPLKHQYHLLLKESIFDRASFIAIEDLKMRGLLTEEVADKVILF